MRALRAARTALLALIALVGLAVVAIVVFTRTPWGVERLGRLGVEQIRGSVQGELRIGRIESSSLLGGVRIRDLSITDRAGQPFLRVDSARATYSWRMLLGGRIVLRSLVLWGPVVHIEQVPGDTAWNFQHIFADTTAGPDGPGRLVRIADVTVRGGTATVAYPLEGDDLDEPADTARLIVRRRGPGVQRVMRFDSVDAELPDVLWSTPEEPGKLVEVGALSAVGYVWETPLRIRDAAGTVAVRDTIVSFDAQVRLPISRADVVGRVIVQEARNDYDVRIDGERLAFADLRWLYERLPERGGGTGVIRILSVPKGTLWLIEDARLQAPGTRIAGTFGIVTGDTLYFTQVSLRASPLDLEVVDAMLPDGLPVDGLLVGTVVVEGPISAAGAADGAGAGRPAASRGRAGGARGARGAAAGSSRGRGV